MQSVNILEAKNTLSRLVDAVERGLEREVVIARNGRPAARLVPMGAPSTGQRLGVAKGAFVVPDSIDSSADEAARLFAGG
jgi:prevent-host-death family protein